MYRFLLTFTDQGFWNALTQKYQYRLELISAINRYLVCATVTIFKCNRNWLDFVVEFVTKHGNLSWSRVATTRWHNFFTSEKIRELSYSFSLGTLHLWFNSHYMTMSTRHPLQFFCQKEKKQKRIAIIRRSDRYTIYFLERRVKDVGKDNIVLSGEKERIKLNWIINWQTESNNPELTMARIQA